jgi:ferredoxin
MTKVQVHFTIEDLLVEAPAGAELMEIAQASGADVTFGCGSGSCGTCRVRIAQGLDHCSAPSPEERDFLQGLEAPPDHRLACQVKVQGDVEVEYIGN